MHPRRAVLPVLPLVLALGLSGCGRENDEKAADPATSQSPASPSASPTRETYPEFEPTDYTYRLEVICFCPMSGPVEVTVAGGKVTSATRLEKPAQGKQAAPFARLSINDIITKANAPGIADAEVTWPDGQDHPSQVRLDQVERATDDEVTYLIGDVRLSAG